MNYTSRLAGELAALGDGDPLFGQQKERDDAWTYFTLRGVDWSLEVSARANAIMTYFLWIFFYRFPTKHTIIAVVIILTILFVFGMTLRANSDHFSKQHSRSLPVLLAVDWDVHYHFCYLKFVFERRRLGPGGQSSASLRRSTGLIPDQSMWALWWAKVALE